MHIHTNTGADVKSKQASLPDLIGAQRQAPWATTIRIEKLTDADAVFARLVSETEANWWIDRRDTAALNMIEAEFLALTPKIAKNMLSPVFDAPQDAPEPEEALVKPKSEDVIARDKAHA